MLRQDVVPCPGRCGAMVQQQKGPCFSSVGSVRAVRGVGWGLGRGGSVVGHLLPEKPPRPSTPFVRGHLKHCNGGALTQQLRQRCSDTAMRQRCSDTVMGQGYSDTAMQQGYIDTAMQQSYSDTPMGQRYSAALVL